MSDRLKTYLLTECVPVLSDENIEQIRKIVLEESEEVKEYRKMIKDLTEELDCQFDYPLKLNEEAKQLLTKYEKT